VRGVVSLLAVLGLTAAALAAGIVILAKANLRSGLLFRELIE
jgi:hypothetical protein